MPDVPIGILNQLILLFRNLTSHLLLLFLKVVKAEILEFLSLFARFTEFQIFHVKLELDLREDGTAITR